MLFDMPLFHPDFTSMKACLPEVETSKRYYRRSYSNDLIKPLDGCSLRNHCRGCRLFNTCPTVNPYKDF